MKPFNKLLVANRGEIACRVMRTARGMGLRTVAVYSDADRQALHVETADESVRIGGPLPSESYLSIESIIDAACRCGAEAIHPGYGFLSENADFAKACADAGLVFVGPSAEAIRLMGNKARAKSIAEKVGAPCVRGYRGNQPTDEELLREARAIGFPILIKAAAGGGGRGMRRVDQEADFLSSCASARREALGAFGSDEIILEQWVGMARHVEIQLLADSYGNVLTFGERDCSAQRRHQKVIEEAPCPVMTDELRARMSESARAIAREASYVNAGTIEFLLDEKNNYYFLEMNTRLQVEHPVTELVTGLDLVELQLRVARGERLAISQASIRLVGASIEARIYAEDPAQSFAPQSGPIRRWRVPASEGIRVDEGVCTGKAVTPYYDPMIAKVIASGPSREEARTRLVNALRNTQLLGIKSNIRFLIDVLESETFVRGETTTRFLDGSESPLAPDPTPGLSILAASSVALIEEASADRGDEERGWRSTGPSRSPIKLAWGEEVFTLQATYLKGNYTVASDEQSIGFTDVHWTGESLRGVVDGIGEQYGVLVEGDEVYVHRAGLTFAFRDITYAPPTTSGVAAGNTIKTPMAGRVIRVDAAVGQRISKGQILVIVEAMKMENQIVATRDGVIETVHVAPGDQVEAAKLLVTLKEEA